MAKILKKTDVERAIAYIKHKAGKAKQSDSKFRKTYEKRLSARLNRRLKRQMRWVIDEMKELSFFNQSKGISRLQRKTARDEAENLAKRLPGSEDIAEDMVEMARPVYKKGAKNSYQKLKMIEYGIDFDLVNQDAIDYLNKLRTIQLSNYRGSISRETKKRIIKILTDMAETGASYTEAAKKIMEQGEVGVFSQARAELIATNQVGRAYGEGNKAMVDRFTQRTGAMVQKSWITVNDDLVTPECEANEAMGWIGYDERFNSGDSIAPRQSNPRCRCDTGYRQVDTQGNPI